MVNTEINGYDLSRNWFDWCFENPDIIKPAHTALYFFAIEHCNRLGWKDKFGLPTQMAMDAIGIKNWRTYSSAFEDIVKWGFIKVYERSKNQYSATVIGVVNNTKANTKALSKATQKHSQKQSSSIVVIDKPINQETNKPINQKYNFDFSFLDLSFSDIFYKWLDYKFARKEKYKTQESLELCYKKLLKFARSDVSTARQIIEDAMANNYAGFFEPKQTGKQTHPFTDFKNNKHYD